MGFVEEKNDMQEFLGVLKKDPTSVFLKVSKDYREREYSNWRHEVRKVAQEATVSVNNPPLKRWAWNNQKLFHVYI
jgi:hypothetical protein